MSWAEDLRLNEPLKCADAIFEVRSFGHDAPAPQLRITAKVRLAASRDSAKRHAEISGILFGDLCRGKYVNLETSGCLNLVVPAALCTCFRVEPDQSANGASPSKFALIGQRVPKQSDHWRAAIGCAIFLRA